MGRREVQAMQTLDSLGPGLGGGRVVPPSSPNGPPLGGSQTNETGTSPPRGSWKLKPFLRDPKGSQELV